MPVVNKLGNIKPLARPARPVVFGGVRRAVALSAENFNPFISWSKK